MSETEVFGVRNPETGELGFVSIMGAGGEHFSTALYLGAKGLYNFWAFADAGPDATAEQLFEIPHLQASFENRNTLHNKDRALIKELGLKFRGRHAWPMFRCYRPGFAPWFLEAQEARFLTHALGQVLDVAPRCKQDPSLLEPTTEKSYLVRVPLEQGDTLTWEDRMIDVAPPKPAPISIAMDVRALNKLKRTRPNVRRIEIDFFLFPVPLGERGERPRFSYNLMLVEAQSGMVLGGELLQPEPSVEEMWGQIPVNVVYLLSRHGMVPQEVRVRSELLLQLLQPLAEELRFKLKRSDRLPGLDAAKEFLLDRFH
jgi:hypothetical protein